VVVGEGTGSSSWKKITVQSTSKLKRNKGMTSQRHLWDTYLLCSWRQESSSLSLYCCTALRRVVGRTFHSPAAGAPKYLSTSKPAIIFYLWYFHKPLVSIEQVSSVSRIPTVQVICTLRVVKKRQPTPLVCIGNVREPEDHVQDSCTW
jgi:hypothetical protein